MKTNAATATLKFPHGEFGGVSWEVRAGGASRIDTVLSYLASLLFPARLPRQPILPGGRLNALASSRMGRVLLHALCLLQRPAQRRWHAAGILRELRPRWLHRGSKI